jgi:hypothetical protein
MTKLHRRQHAIYYETLTLFCIVFGVNNFTRELYETFLSDPGKVTALVNIVIVFFDNYYSA